MSDPQVAPFIVREPLVIIYRDHGQLVTMIHPSATEDSYEGYGLILCDLVRHVARAFHVAEEAVWEWVDRERARPTTAINEIHRQ